MPRYAAVDIGSNSIRMLAAEAVGGTGFKTLASSRQVTRLGASVFRTGRVSQSAMDVGGGSAELILSEHGRMRQAFSKPLGALRLAEVFLKGDPPSAVELHRMEEYIEERIVDAVRRFGGAPYDRAIATSATAAAVICAVNRIPRAKRDSADRLRASASQVGKFYHAVAARDLESRRKIPGLGPKRAEIIVPGVGLLM